MLTITALWLPILLSAVFVFVASSLIHMVIQWHKPDYRQLPNEDQARAVLGSAPLPPGQYVTPYCPDGKAMKEPAMQQQFKQGPIATIIVRPNGTPSVAAMLVQWLVFALVVATLAAALACTVMGRGAEFHNVFHFFALITFMTYAGGSFINGIWMGRLWSAVARDVVDSVVYAAITGATFAYLWPH